MLMLIRQCDNANSAVIKPCKNSPTIGQIAVMFRTSALGEGPIEIFETFLIKEA
jgi:hypothetical protein